MVGFLPMFDAYEGIYTAIINEARIGLDERMDVTCFGIISINSALVFITLLINKKYLRNFYDSHNTINW